MERDLRQLAAAGLIEIVEWHPATPGREPQPTSVRFSPIYQQAITQIITTLHQLLRQARPTSAGPVEDERAQTVRRFFRAGQLVALPVQFKRKLYVLEEIAKAFTPGTRYPEREVDTILKGIYDDHCTLRRLLVDLKFLQRDHGVYWRVE